MINRQRILAIEWINFLDRSVVVGIIHSYITSTERLISSQTNEVVKIRRENSGGHVLTL